MLSFRRPKNLIDHLVRSKLRREKGIGKMVWLNVIRRGAKCAILSHGNKFKSNVTGRTYYVDYVFDCDLEGVVYLITCKK